MPESRLRTFGKITTVTTTLKSGSASVCAHWDVFCTPLISVSSQAENILSMTWCCCQGGAAGHQAPPHITIMRPQYTATKTPLQKCTTITLEAPVCYFFRRVPLWPAAVVPAAAAAAAAAAITTRQVPNKDTFKCAAHHKGTAVRHLWNPSEDVQIVCGTRKGQHEKCLNMS